MAMSGTGLLSLLAGLLYVGASVRAWQELRAGRSGGRVVWTLALAGLSAQLGALAWQRWATGRLAWAGGASGSLGLFAAWVTVAYALLTLRYRGPVLGALLLPVASLASMTGAVWGLVRGGEGAGRFGLGWVLVHIAPTVVGIACLAAGAALAAMYLLAEGYLRRRRLGGILRWLPALETLDQLSGRAVVLTFGLLTLGLAAGGVRAGFTGELGAGWAMDPKVLSSAATWVLVGAVLAARRRGGLWGRRLACLILVAAALAAFTYVGVDALLGGGHARL